MLQFAPGEIRALAKRYGYTSDAEAREAGRQARRRGHYTHSGFLMVCRWKAARNTWRVEANTPESIRQATTIALAAKSEAERIEALTALRGVGVPVASALLHFAFPDRYPILDYRALESLGHTARRTTYTTLFWISYQEACRQIARENGVSVRTLDKALWQHSRECGRAR